MLCYIILYYIILYYIYNIIYIYILNSSGMPLDVNICYPMASITPSTSLAWSRSKVPREADASWMTLERHRLQIDSTNDC